MIEDSQGKDGAEYISEQEPSTKQDSLDVSQPLKKCKSIKLYPADLLTELPQEHPVTQVLGVLLEVLTDTEFYSAYSSLSDEHKSIVVRFFGKLRNELLERRNIDYGRSPEELFHEYRAESYLDLTPIENLSLSEDAQFLLHRYRWNIQRYGNNAIAHICPSMRLSLHLSRAGIETIEDAEQLLRSNKKVTYVTSRDRTELALAIEDWRKYDTKSKNDSDFNP